jgi:hypothetical protein
MAVTVSRQPPTAEACVRSQASPCHSWWTEWYWDGFFGENLGFPLSYHSTNASYLTLILILPTIVGRTNGRSLGTFKHGLFRHIVENLREKYVYVSVLKGLGNSVGFTNLLPLQLTYWWTLQEKISMDVFLGVGTRTEVHKNHCVKVAPHEQRRRR